MGEANHLYLLTWLRMSAAIPHSLFILSWHKKGLYVTLIFTFLSIEHILIQEGPANV